MNEKQTKGQFSQPNHYYSIRLPVFIADEPIGLGDVIKRATKVIGISSCASCNRRAAALNRWVVFSSRTQK